MSSYSITLGVTYDWNSTGVIQFRNESRHKAWKLIGTGLGILTGIAIVAGSKDRKGDFASPFAVPLATAMGGMLVGHLLTAAKVTIPYNGKSSKE